ncbi:VWA domain-containing protein [Sulfidibacter corallicola]|uniref:VWA domain-containing protein n=1 Tax=Sulfidibacter corallicola TaxID=2818388 RepID=A0A8A4TPG5_SULCO|nr:VWA domain-containing protein [Sulfidibacter corallicola]QTD51443.1 VWA domain-containing protein [Sulfidibacter corallicola]
MFHSCLGIWLGVTTLLSGGTLGFQTQTIEEELRVTYVLLDVKASDRKGNPVKDLQMSDFVVTENRKKVNVTYFEVKDYALDIPEEVLTGQRDYDVSEVPKGVRQVIVALDFESMNPIETAKTFKMLLDFLGSLKGPSTYLINIHSLERGSITKGFVSSPKRAIQAVAGFQERYENLKYRGGQRELLLADSRGDRASLTRGYPGTGGYLTDPLPNLEDLEKACETCVRQFGYRGVGSDMSDYMNNCIRESLRAFMDKLEARSERVLGELEILANAYPDREGLKLMFFVSPGFSLREPAAANQLARFYMQQGRGDSQSISSMPIGRSFDFDDSFRRVVHACIRNRVIFHTFDAYTNANTDRRTLGAEFASSGNARNELSRYYRQYGSEITGGLRDLADESGGSFSQTISLSAPMGKVLEKNYLFYVLGYDSPPGKSNKFRKIKIKSKRRGVRLSYRRGYYGP